MIPRKYEKYVFSFLMALVMSCIMSLVISIFNVGLVSNIVSIWLSAWGFGFVIAFPTVVIVSPLVRTLMELIMRDD